MALKSIAEVISLDQQKRVVYSAKNAGPTQSFREVESQPDSDQLQAAARIINILFAELQSCFPAWKATFPSKSDVDAAKRTWSKGLLEAGITTEQQLKYGLRKARQEESPFWPSLGQFVKWCQPEPADHGLPSVRQAYTEACRKSHPAADRSSWSHPAVYIAAREVGSFELTNLPSSQSQPLFERAYAIAVRRVMAGEDLNTEIPKALPEQPAPRPVDPEVARKHIDRLKKMLRGC
ncbi:replication protein P [Providencia stuartii]|uniref:replication protein P n=1 Tax=Providencia stuartii TaxID=588 RepID=UPI0033192D8B